MRLGGCSLTVDSMPPDRRGTGNPVTEKPPVDASIISDVVVGGVLAALVLALWRDVRSLGERVARLEGWLERDRSAAAE